MLKRIFRITLFLLISIVCSRPAKGMSLSGPVIANSVTVTGGITISSVTVSTLTISSELNMTSAAVQIPGQVVQMAISSSTLTTCVTTTTWTPISNISLSITPLNETDYVRISLGGDLTSDGNGFSTYITVYRDSTNLGDPTLGLSACLGIGYGIPWNSAGITIIDRPGDTNTHTYQAYIHGGTFFGTLGPACYPDKSTGYLFIEEIGQ